MDPAAPWRSLEDPPAGASSSPSAVPSGEPNAPGVALDRRLIATGGALVMAAVLAIGAILIATGSGHGSVVVDGAGPGASVDDVLSSGAASAAGELVVDVQGAVVHPGILRLPAGSRVADAIAAAGGYSARVAADRVASALNLAALVRDGDQVVVPSRDDPASGSSAGSSSPGGGGDASGALIDLNHASAEELDTLPGVGPATAAKIIAAREEQPFTSVDELRTRKIVGEATFAKLQDRVVVR